MDNTNKLLPVSVSVSVVQKKLIVMASAVPPLTAFHLVNLWTLLNAFSITFAFAYDIADRLMSARYYASIRSMSMTDDAADDILGTTMLWRSTPQAVAGTLALLLPCHWRRLCRASAYTGLAVTIAGNCILATGVRAIVVDDPENLLFRFVGSAGMFMYMVCDLLGFLAVVRGAGEEQQAYLINLADLFT